MLEVKENLKKYKYNTVQISVQQKCPILIQNYIKNNRKALWPLIETWDAFWVRNVENSNNCLDFYMYRSGGKSCNTPTGLSCYEPDLFKKASCDQEKTFVCERDLL